MGSVRTFNFQPVKPLFGWHAQKGSAVATIEVRDKKAVKVR